MDVNRGRYTASELPRLLETLSSLHISDYYFVADGRVVKDVVVFARDAHPLHTISLRFRLRGGKGGFGSLLRSFRMQRSANQDMCRDLNGRRIGDVREEERLKKWIERAAAREEERIRKRQAKIERLKSAGNTKHDFNDPDYIRAREDILSNTEDAVAAGFLEFLKAHKAEIKRKKKLPKDGPSTSKSSAGESSDEFDSSASSSEDEDEGQGPGPSKKARQDDATNTFVSEADAALEARLAAQRKVREDAKAARESYEREKREEKERMEREAKERKRRKEEEAKRKEEERKKKEAMDFPAVELGEYEDAKELEQLGLDHLWHALNARGLKCGGSLEERAARLFSVKGLQPEKYPKNICAVKRKI